MNSKIQHYEHINFLYTYQIYNQLTIKVMRIKNYFIIFLLLYI